MPVESRKSFRVKNAVGSQKEQQEPTTSNVPSMSMVVDTAGAGA